MQGMQQKLEKSCFRCKKNTWHVESDYILQPPKYLIFIVNQSRYINNNFAKDRCSTPMDMTIVLGLHKFSLQTIIDHHRPRAGASTRFMSTSTSTSTCNMFEYEYEYLITT